MTHVMPDVLVEKMGTHGAEKRRCVSETEHSAWGMLLRGYFTGDQLNAVWLYTSFS